MAKQEQYTQPLPVFFLYIAAAFILLCVYRFIVPLTVSDPVEILDCFKLSWRFTGGVLTFIHLFPALAFSGLVIPFGLKEHSEGGYAGSTFVGKKGFSASFLKYLAWPVITASTAAVIYSLLFFLILPITVNVRAVTLNRSVLYAQARGLAQSKYAARDYAEALRFIGICERIWPGNETVAKLKLNSTEAFAAGQAPERAENVFSQRDDVQSLTGIPGDPVNSTDALAAAVKAFDEERYYDAHWLATLAQRLARPGAAEITTALVLASQAWEKITVLEPNAKEKEQYALYRLKRDGYEAMLAGDWVSAFYTFKELSTLTPADPDVVNYFAASKNGVADIAFFGDELDLAAGTVLTGPVFSLPFEDGRLVLRCASLALLPDHAYAWDLEAIASGASGDIRFSLSTGYAKCMPLSGGENTTGKMVLLLRSLDRNRKEIISDPVWVREDDLLGNAGLAGAGTEGAAAEDPVFGVSRIFLEVSYDDFLLLSRMEQGMDALNLRELFIAEQRFEQYGYAAKSFRAGILRRLGDTVFFLPAAVFALILGWRYRAQKKPRYVYVPMLCLLPLGFYVFVLFYRQMILDNLSVWLSLNMGFTLALVTLCAGSGICFLLMLVLLAAQHG